MTSGIGNELYYPLSNPSGYATGTQGTGEWDNLIGTTPIALQNGIAEFALRCGGTAGWINVSDFSAGMTNPARMRIWNNGLPINDESQENISAYIS